MKLEYWLWLVLVMGAGNPKIWDIIHVTKTPERAYDILKDPSQRQRFHLNENQKRNAANNTLEHAKKIITLCETKNISITYYDHESYPEQLRHIHNAPVVLFYQGDIDILSRYAAVTVVGTRKPTEYSVRVADRICSDLAKTGVVIVSGFAIGIDSAAHRAALLSKGRTVAVLGCGIDVDYPRNNASAKKYIVNNGLLLTEFLPGTEPLPRNFPARNRIMSAISLGTLVVEASERSGALITASLALEQGKSVFCIPPADLFDNRYAGVVKYLRDGAIPVFSYLDIINVYYTDYAHKLKPSVLFDMSHSADKSSVFPESSESGTRSRTVSKDRKKAEIEAADEKTDEEAEGTSEEKQHEEVSEKREVKDFSGLDGLELRIAVLLSQEHQMHIDAIVERLEVDEDEAASALTELSISGYITRFSGQCYGIL